MRRQSLFLAVLFSFAFLSTPALCEPDLARIEAEFGRIAELSGGVMGISAIHLESGKTAGLNAAESFPMASTVKIPIALKVLDLVDEGELALDTMIEIERRDRSSGSGIIRRLIDNPGAALSVRNLLDLMLQISDNTATDVLLRVIGGPEAVAEHLRRHDLEGIDVSRNIKAMLAGTISDPDYASDPRDSTTPEAMAMLLRRLWSGALLSEESTELLLNIMKRCETGQDRIPGMLPPDTAVAHKTGSTTGVVNDVGIITLPGEAGNVAFAAFIKKSDADEVECAAAIAHAARAAHDFFGVNSLQEAFARLEPISGGVMGIAAGRLTNGAPDWTTLNPGAAFPLASAYKVPIAVQLLTRIDQGKLSLSKMIPFGANDLSPGSGTISHLFDDPGLSVSIHNLLELMLLISDNSATDLCLREAGGGRAVTERMAALGLDGVRVDRSTYQLIADYLGVYDLPASRETLDWFDARIEAMTDEQRKEARAAFDADPRDTATPEDMAELLRLIWTDQALSAESSALLRDIMDRCETGPARIQGFLPEYVPVANKTGTISGTTNDVGVLTLPDGAGEIILVAFVKESDLPVPERELAIAHVARTAYNYYLFNPGE